MSLGEKIILVTNIEEKMDTLIRYNLNHKGRFVTIIEVGNLPTVEWSHVPG